jgi:methylated-DNA-protein-cysteine methyltransferase-like protein
MKTAAYNSNGYQVAVAFSARTRYLRAKDSNWAGRKRMNTSDPSVNERIWQVVTAIPPGRVTTYGAIAQKAGLARSARRVGYALRGLPADTRIPWHRVVNAGGQISLPQGSAAHRMQRDRLEHEGIRFGPNGAIDLRKYGW